MKIKQSLEIDLPRCTRSYGVAPCTASGSEKCYNTADSCQDVNNYAQEIQVLKFSTPFGDGLPLVKKIDVQPQRIGICDSMGSRERATVTLDDAQHSDDVFDKYYSTRDYIAFNTGTLFDKLFSRYTSFDGFGARVINENDEGFSETLHYVVDTAMQTDGGARFDLCDALKLLDDSKARFPYPCTGVLSGPIITGNLTFTLSPSGIGSALNPNGSPMYPASGWATIGGDEVVTYTRSGDVITLTSRGQRGTQNKDHAADATFQWIYRADSKPLHLILQDVLTGYLPAEYIDPADWNANIAPFNSFLYSGFVGEPTAIKTAIVDLIRDAGLITYTDIQSKKIKFMQARPFVNSGFLNDEIISGQKKTPAKDGRITACYSRYSRLSPVEKMDAEKNYRSRIFTVSSDPREAIKNNTPVIFDHFSRWSDFRPAISFAADVLLGVKKKNALEIECSTTLDFAPQLAQTVEIETRLIKGFSGKIQRTPMIVTQRSVDAGRVNLTLLEYSYNLSPPVAGDIFVPLERSELNMGGAISLRAIYDSFYSAAPASGRNVVFAADAGIIYGSNTVASFSVIVGDWPAGVNVFIDNLYIAGKGGESYPNVPYSSILYPETGGGGLYTRRPVTLRNCTVQGGGGGGNGWTRTSSWINSNDVYWAGEAGGAGSVVGRTSAVIPVPGDFDLATLTTGGRVRERFYNSPEKTTYGGAPGMPGIAADPDFFPNIGQGGIAIDGIAFVTNIGSTILGATV
jgi:hypothetical protein